MSAKRKFTLWPKQSPGSLKTWKILSSHLEIGLILSIEKAVGQSRHPTKRSKYRISNTEYPMSNIEGNFVPSRLKKDLTFEVECSIIYN